MLNENTRRIFLIISEIITEKRALRKKHPDYWYNHLRFRYRSKGYNEILIYEGTVY